MTAYSLWKFVALFIVLQNLKFCGFIRIRYRLEAVNKTVMSGGSVKDSTTS
jgi:hypothetical protein